jgi:hypothetical protein
VASAAALFVVSQFEGKMRERFRMKGKNDKVHRRKYQPDMLISMFRKAAALRNEMLEAGFTDNGGAIHSAERILNILGLSLNYPELSHINNLRHSEKAVFSIEALELHNSGHKVLIEHVSPLRNFTQKAIEEIDQKVSDAQFKAFVQEHYKLVLLSPGETQRLNRQNRTKMNPDRLKQADIQLAVLNVELVALPDSN